jgi:hypothetical protein
MLLKKLSLISKEKLKELTPNTKDKPTNTTPKLPELKDKSVMPKKTLPPPPNS